MDPDPSLSSPFHAGEREVQERLGVRDKVEAYARRAVRDHLPEQHRAFYGELPFVMVGSVDGQSRPWASLVAGQPGFITSTDPRRLDIAARPLAGDPLATTLRPGADVGLLGIQLATRRRNRLNGRIAAADEQGFAVAIDQTFGNCPRFIQDRTVEILPTIGAPGPARSIAHSDRLGSRARALLARADTLFVATAYAGARHADARDPTQGVDVSHRGGKPGFVRVLDERTFAFPDFSGNNHFNTAGNIVRNPKAGFLFLDFATGNLVYLTGAAEIVWDGPEVEAFTGAERLIRCQVHEVIRVEGGLPLRFTFGSWSPLLERTGNWPLPLSEPRSMR